MSTIPPDQLWAKDSAGNTTEIGNDASCVGFQKNCPKPPALAMTSAVMNGSFQWLQKWVCDFFISQTCEAPIIPDENAALFLRDGHIIVCNGNGDIRRVPAGVFGDKPGAVINVDYDNYTLSLNNSSGSADCYVTHDATQDTATYMTVPAGTSATFALRHDNYNSLVLGSVELAVNGVWYAGSPKSTPLTTGQPLVNSSAGIVKELVLQTEETQPGGFPITVTSILRVYSEEPQS